MAEYTLSPHEHDIRPLDPLEFEQKKGESLGRRLYRIIKNATAPHYVVIGNGISHSGNLDLSDQDLQVVLDDLARGHLRLREQLKVEG